MADRPRTAGFVNLDTTEVATRNRPPRRARRRPTPEQTSFDTPRLTPKRPRRKTVGPLEVNHAESCLGLRTRGPTLDGFPSDSADFWSETIGPPAFQHGRTPHDALWSHKIGTHHHGSKAEPHTPSMERT